MNEEFEIIFRGVIAHGHERVMPTDFAEQVSYEEFVRDYAIHRLGHSGDGVIRIRVKGEWETFVYLCNKNKPEPQIVHLSFSETGDEIASMQYQLNHFLDTIHESASKREEYPDSAIAYGSRGFYEIRRL